MPEIHYTVDGERQSTTHHKLTPTQILKDAGIDPATHYLKQRVGHKIISYKDKPHEEIEMHDGMKFVSVYTGGTPVSMPQQDFIDQLKQAGYEVEELGDNKVSIPYNVPGGKFEGQDIKLGFEIPGDFPLTPPAGVNVSPRLLPLNPDAPNHPEKVGESKFGDGWEFWSRKIEHWNQTKRTANDYIRFVNALFEKQ
jgi:hypothetical protein